MRHCIVLSYSFYILKCPPGAPVAITVILLQFLLLLDRLFCTIRANPHYTQNPQAAQGPLALKDDYVLVSLLNFASDYENMNDNLL